MIRRNLYYSVTTSATKPRPEAIYHATIIPIKLAEEAGGHQTARAAPERSSFSTTSLQATAAAAQVRLGTFARPHQHQGQPGYGQLERHPRGLPPAPVATEVQEEPALVESGDAAHPLPSTDTRRASTACHRAALLPLPTTPECRDHVPDRRAAARLQAAQHPHAARRIP